MKRLFALSTLLVALPSMAATVEFDRPGVGLGADIVPKGHVAWEQSLPAFNYDQRKQNGIETTTSTIQTDSLLRIGVGAGAELRIGWDGYVWQRNKVNSIAKQQDGVGDLSIGIKKSIPIADESVKWALLAEVNLADGDDEFSAQEEIYTLASALSFDLGNDLGTGITMAYGYQDERWAWTVIPSMTYPVLGNVSGFSEFVYRKQESQHYESMINTGLVWSLNDKLQLDGSIGYSFESPDSTYNAALGIAYLF